LSGEDGVRRLEREANLKLDGKPVFRKVE